MRALITRPEEDSRPLAEALEARGIEALVEPLLSIRALPGTPIDLDGVQAILITSANGLRALSRRISRRDLRVLAVGDGSAEAASLAGFTTIDSAQGDVSALAALVVERLRPGDGALFHAAGSQGAGDLKGQLERAGFTIRRAELYEAVPAFEFSAPIRANLSQGGIDCVLLFSPRTARIFVALWRKTGEPALARIAALCLSAAVAREIKALDWARTEIATKPDLPAMLALVDAERERIARMAEENPQPQPDAAPVEPAEAEAAAPKPAEAPVETRAPSSGRKGGLLGAILAGAISAALITLAAPYWMQAIGIPDARDSGPTTDELAALRQAIADKAGSAEVAAATDPLRQQLESLGTSLETARQDFAALSSEFEALKSAEAGGETAMPAPAIDLAPIEDRIAKLELSLAETALLVSETTQAQAEPNQIAEAARQTLEAENRALRDRIDELARQIEEMAALSPRLGEIETRLGEIPAETARQHAAALIVALGQLQSALTDDRAFVTQLRTVKDLAVGDEAIWDRIGPIIDILEPLAEAGVPTRSQLAAGFPGTEIARKAEADLAGSLVEDAPWWKRLMHRLSEVVTVRPVGGDVEGEGALERLARAESDLAEGDLAAAILEIGGITGTAKEVAAGWMGQAQARIAVDEAAAVLAEISARALEPGPGGAG